MAQRPKIGKIVIPVTAEDIEEGERRTQNQPSDVLCYQARTQQECQGHILQLNPNSWLFRTIVIHLSVVDLDITGKRRTYNLRPSDILRYQATIQQGCQGHMVKPSPSYWFPNSRKRCHGECNREFPEKKRKTDGSQ